MPEGVRGELPPEDALGIFTQVFIVGEIADMSACPGVHEKVGLLDSAPQPKAEHVGVYLSAYSL